MVGRAGQLAELRGWTQFVGLQIEYSLIERTVERELIPMAKAFNLGLIAWSPLAGGLLSGKYHSGGGKDGRFSSEMGKAFQHTGERPDRIVAALQTVSQQVDRSLKWPWRGCATVTFRSFPSSVPAACRSCKTTLLALNWS